MLLGYHRANYAIGNQKKYIQSIKTSESKNRKYSLKILGEVCLIKDYLDEGFTLPAAVKKKLKKKKRSHELYAKGDY